MNCSDPEDCMLPQEYLLNYDPELAEYMGLELERQRTHIELIASENFVSPAVMAAMGSALTNKYAEGYPGHRYYGGCEHVDKIEQLAIDRAKELFHAEHANVQPHSGSQANLAVYHAFLQPGDTILAMSLNDGGHLTHGSPVNASGKLYNVIPYGVRHDTETIDYDSVRELAVRYKPKMIVAGASSYSRVIDFDFFRSVADQIGALFMVDMAHIAGLVAVGEHPNPVLSADIVTSTTHKTLRGPRGGLILCREQFAKKVNSSVFPGCQGGPLMHVIAAKAVCFKEAMQDGFKAYQHQIVLNASALAAALQKEGIRIVSGGTENHVMLADVSSIGLTGKDAQELLDLANITCNKNAIPFDQLPPRITSGIRLGTAAVTTRGMKEKEMALIGHLIVRTLKNGADVLDSVRDEVLDLCRLFPLY